MDDVALRFSHGSPPYVPGDVAGFPPAIAQKYLARGVAELANPPALEVEDTSAGDGFSSMDRAALIAFGKADFGMVDEPPAETTDDQLREALRAAQADKAKKAGKGK